MMNNEINKSEISKISKNAIANIVGKVWAMLSLYIFIPYYLKVLGSELFGIVSLFTTLQSMLLLFSGGFTTVFRREFALTDNNKESKNYKYRLMRSMEVIYVVISIMIIVVCSAFSGFITNSWLNIGSLDITLVKDTIRLMSISIAISIYVTMYSGGLAGIEKQVMANGIYIVYSLLRSGGVCIVLWLFGPDIRIFFVWYIMIDVLGVVVNRIALLKALHIPKTDRKWTLVMIREMVPILAFIGGAYAISIFSMLNSQVDKLLISKYMSLSDVTYYNLSYTLSSIPTMIVSSIIYAVFPKFVQGFERENRSENQKMFKNFEKLFALISISVGVFMFEFVQDIMMFWLHDALVVSCAVNAARILIIGNTVLSLQVIPDNYLLAGKNTRVINIRNILTLPVLICILPIFIRNWGYNGAAWFYFGYMLIMTALYNGYVHHYLINKDFIRWNIVNIIIPGILIIGSAKIFHAIRNITGLSISVAVFFAVFCGAFTLLIVMFSFSVELRKYAIEKLKGGRWQKPFN